MPRGHRVLDVTARTTLDRVEAAARGPGWTEEGTGILDVRSAADDPDGVALEFEADPTALDRVGVHADSLRLTAGQARELIAAIEAAIEADGPDRPGRLGG